MTAMPSGHTNDMNIALPSPHTLGEVVELVFASGRAGTPAEATQRELMKTFGLTEYDADLAWDRIHGGVVRAATRNVANRPDKSNDPLAWTSFQLATADPSIIAALYPQYARQADALPDGGRKRWWRFWR